MHRGRVAQVVLLAALTVIAGGLSAAAFMHRPDPPRGGTIHLNPLKPLPPDIRFNASLSEAMSRLRTEPKRPFTILVIGDSTDLDMNIGWLKLTMDWLAKTTGRPWIQHQWHAKDPNYGPDGYFKPPWTFGGGYNAPIVLWNDSPGGEDFVYAQDHLDAMLKNIKSVDLLIVNHGHNLSPGQWYDVGFPLIKRVHERFPEAAPIVIAQNPEKGKVAKHHSMVAIRDQVAEFAAKNHVPMVDVYTAFENTGHPNRLIDHETLRHPTARGYRIWFGLVRNLLEKAMRP